MKHGAHTVWLMGLLVVPPLLWAKGGTYNSHDGVTILGGGSSGGAYLGFPKSGYSQGNAGVYSGVPDAYPQRAADLPAPAPVPYWESLGRTEVRPFHHYVGRDDQEDPPPPYVYLRGRDIGRDQASNSRTFIGDGIPDTWLRFNARNLGWYLGKKGGYGTSGYGVKAFILRTRGGSVHRQWDTLPHSSYPLLQVIYQAQRINDATGSIAGFLPAGDDKEMVELFIGDDGLIAGRHTPLEFQVITLDGSYTVEVRLSNFWDYKID
ncbi:hypothetical protein CCP4SC76_5580005 [Gammaproteobacteria bacterium]